MQLAGDDPLRCITASVNTSGMSARPVRGALLGAVIAALLVVTLVLGPAVVTGDFYEVTDPLVFAGLPLVLLGASVGLALGAATRTSRRHVTAPSPATTMRQGSRYVQRFLLAVAVVGSLAAGWMLLSATGVIGHG